MLRQSSVLDPDKKKKKKQWYDCQCLGLLTCPQLLMRTIPNRCCTNTMRESALKGDCGRKIPLLCFGVKSTSVWYLAFRSNALVTELPCPTSRVCFLAKDASLHALRSPFLIAPVLFSAHRRCPWWVSWSTSWESWPSKVPFLTDTHTADFHTAIPMVGNPIRNPSRSPMDTHTLPDQPTDSPSAAGHHTDTLTGTAAVCHLRVMVQDPHMPPLITTPIWKVLTVRFFSVGGGGISRHVLQFVFQPGICPVLGFRWHMCKRYNLSRPVLVSVLHFVSFWH